MAIKFKEKNSSDSSPNLNDAETMNNDENSDKQTKIDENRNEMQTNSIVLGCEASVSYVYFANDLNFLIESETISPQTKMFSNKLGVKNANMMQKTCSNQSKEFPAHSTPNKANKRKAYSNKPISKCNVIKRHECPICCKVFTKNFYLENHKRVHSGERPFNCKTCGKDYIQSGHLHKHMKTHTVKYFKCELCDKEFMEKNNLKAHMKTHPMQSQYQCSNCKQTFSKEMTCKQHEMMCNKKGHECGICNYYTLYKGNLLRHMCTHDGIKPFECSKCDYKCVQRTHLDAHNKIHHINSF